MKMARNLAIRRKKIILMFHGCMADAAIATLIEDAENGIVTYEQFCSAITPYDEDNQDQLSFHTKLIAMSQKARRKQAMGI